MMICFRTLSVYCLAARIGYHTRMAASASQPVGGPAQWIRLGIAVTGLTASVTVLALFLPLVVADLTSSDLAVGFAVGIEGLAAMIIPVVVGRSTDHSGRRKPYLIAATPFVVFGLLAVAAATTYWMIIGAVILYFIGYYGYYTVYQTLYPDTLPDREYGRAWAYQSVFQGIAVGVALIGGGILFENFRSWAFVAAAALFLIVAIYTILTIHGRGKGRGGSRAPWAAMAHLGRSLKRDPVLRLNLGAHFLWEFTLAALRAFVLLYLTRGLGLELDQLMPLLIGVVIIYLIASVLSGQVTDRGNLRPYATAVIIAYAVAMLVAGLTTNHWALAVIFPFGMFGGAAIMMLAYPIMLKTTDLEHRVAYTAYYQANRGLALLLGTSGTGFAIDALGTYFPASGGYQVMWLVGAVAAFASLPLYRRLPQNNGLA